MLVDAVMTRSVVTTEPQRSVRSAARLMRDGRFRHLPVLQRGHVVGIVSDRDVIRGEVRTVGEVMHGKAITITPDTPIELAAELMLDNKNRGPSRREDGTDTLVGIVTQSDLFSVLARLLGSDTPSTRLELRLNDLAAQLAKVMALAHERHIAIAGLLMLPAQPGDARARRIVLRIGTLVATPFVSALRASGIEVEVPEEPEEPPARAAVDV